MALDGFRKVDWFATVDDQASGRRAADRDMSPERLLARWTEITNIAKASHLPGMKPRPPQLRELSLLQHAFLTARLGVNASGVGVDLGEATLLADAWHWWDANVRDRIWDPTRDHQINPPRRPADHVDQATAGLYVDAVQQLEWWDAHRRTGGGHPARKQVKAWTRIRDAATDPAREGLRRVAAVIERHEQPFVAHPTPAPLARIGKW